MKKAFLGAVFGILFLATAFQANAQLQFWNNTGCNVRVMGVYSNDPNPCMVGPHCVSPWIGVPPFGVGVLPAGNCPLPPLQNSNYVKIQISFGGPFFGTDICGGGPVPVFDCTGAAYTLQMFSYNFASVF